ncbi:hypothetical protein CPB85DRAFT_1322395 [Mucidula mucida]|nr:hypothetical protein CPB85DRAFT_1322395 [Mucidula mucida]
MRWTRLPPLSGDPDSTLTSHSPCPCLWTRRSAMAPKGITVLYRETRTCRSPPTKNPSYPLHRATPFPYLRDLFKPRLVLIFDRATTTLLAGLHIPFFFSFPPAFLFMDLFPPSSSSSCCIFRHSSDVVELRITLCSTNEIQVYDVENDFDLHYLWRMWD